MKKLLFLFCFLLSGIAKSQEYNCVFLEQIMPGAKQKGKEFNVYSSVKASKVKAVKGELSIKMQDMIADSLRKCCGYQNFFSNPLFSMGNNILIIDTFQFFSNDCLINKKYGITISNNIKDLSRVGEFRDIVRLMHIRVYKDNFIIRLQHVKSNLAVDFIFQLIAEHSPELIKVTQGWIE